jgi:hypothetical protein
MDLILKNQTFQPVAKAWLHIAMLSLAIAGLFSLPPVILRGSFFEQFFDIQHVFDVALMIHVNLSVLVWMFAINALLLAYVAQKHIFFYRVSHRVALVACLCMAAAPFIGESTPYKNNYVPILHNILFLLGLALFTCSILFQAVLSISNLSKKSTPLEYGLYSCAAITLIALLCFVIAYHIIPSSIVQDRLHYYEVLFWGGGHIIQLTYTATMTIVWLWFAQLCNIVTLQNYNRWNWLFALNLIAIIVTPLFYINGIEESSILFTEHMRFIGGILPTIAGAYIIKNILTNRQKTQNHTIYTALAFSMILFFFGGVLGFLISGSNAVIPAHYHGSIVGITLAFMGVVYHLTPKFGYAAISNKWQHIQLWVYGIGQLSHISGLALMGGYGALRKAAGTAASIETAVGKLLFFAGGIIEILGGLLFVILVYRAFYK